MSLKILTETLSEWGLSLSEDQLGQLAALLGWMEAQGHPHSAIASAEEVEIKHLLDSLSCLCLYSPPPYANILDVGSGAGYPGLVLKIAWPQAHFTLLDAVRKKVDHLRDISRALKLEGVEVLHDRAENLGRAPKYREHFDAVVARAVAPTNVLAELCLPLVRVGGNWLIMKGPGGRLELTAAQEALQLLGGHVEKEVLLDLPRQQGFRHLALVSKIAPTPPRYPRRAGIPQKRPL